MKKHLLFRADGDTNTGLGHLYRLFALVEMVKDDFDFTFVTSESSMKSVIPSEYTVLTIPKNIRVEEEPSWILNRFKPQTHIFIADGYGFTSSYQKLIKGMGFKLVYIDDLVSEYMYADVVINHSPWINENEYNKEPMTKIASGTHYAMLRPSFLEAAKRKRQVYKMTDVFVCFGGADPLNLTQVVLDSLFSIDQVKRIHILKGAANNFELNNKSEHFEILVYNNLNEEGMVNLMEICDCAIVPSSTILFELSSVKMPILSGYFTDNQMNIYNGFLEESAIFGIGDFREYTSEQLSIEISHFFGGINKQKMMDKQALMFDEKISERVKQLIFSLC